jgi:hypothetical protein
MASIRRAQGTAQRSTAAVVTATIRAMTATPPDNLLGRWTRRCWDLTWCSELVGLDVADLAFIRDGLVLTLRRSRTDQKG